MRRSALVLFLGLVSAVPLLISIPPPAPSDEGFLVLMLMRTRIGIERLQAKIETGEQEIEANRQIMETAEKKLQIAKETRNRQASIIPANDLSRARTARRELAKAQSLRKRALARAEDNAAALKALVAGGDAAGPGRPVLAMATPLSGSANVRRKNGAKVALQEGRAGFLSAGDEVSSTGLDHIELQALDGRAIIQLHGGSRIGIVGDALEAQTLQLVQGAISAVVETRSALDRAVEERFRTPEDDLTPFLRRYQAQTGAERGGPADKVLSIRVLDAVCAVTEGRFDVGIMEGGPATVVVSEGTVEVSDLKGEKRVAVEAGHEVIVAKEGISAPRKRTPSPSSPAARPTT